MKGATNVCRHQPRLIVNVDDRNAVLLVVKWRQCPRPPSSPLVPSEAQNMMIEAGQDVEYLSQTCMREYGF